LEKAGREQRKELDDLKKQIEARKNTPAKSRPQSKPGRKEWTSPLHNGD
jgi:hypothetical protein